MLKVRKFHPKKEISINSESIFLGFHLGCRKAMILFSVLVFCLERERKKKDLYLTLEYIDQIRKHKFHFISTSERLKQNTNSKLKDFLLSFNTAEAS